MSICSFEVDLDWAQQPPVKCPIMEHCKVADFKYKMTPYTTISTPSINTITTTTLAAAANNNKQRISIVPF